LQTVKRFKVAYQQERHRERDITLILVIRF